jgi:hypothetical protein
MNRIIYQKGNYRIVELEDTVHFVDDLKGDMFNPECCPDIHIDDLKKQEKEFEQIVSYHGVYGYSLERWNPKIDKGWEHIDSCWGFVGEYNENDDQFNHYIVEELKNKLNKG